MTDDIVVTLRAERGAKYDETGQCIASYNRSIVFLPRSVQPDEMIRVRLIHLEGKVDKKGRAMYRAEYAPIELPMDCKNTIAQEACLLREGQALPCEQGEAILRAKGVAGGSGYGWYYFCGNETFGSSFSPAALMALEFLPCASGPGLTELLAWIVENGYYSATQENGQCRTPELSDQALVDLAGRTNRDERVLSVRVE